jgi:hypothetical protein
MRGESAVPKLERELEDESVRDDDREPLRPVPPRKPIRGHKQPKRTSGAGVLIVVACIVAAAVVGVRLYQARSGSSKSAEPASTGPVLSPAEAKVDQLVQKMAYAPGSAFFTDLKRGYATVLRCTQFSDPDTCTEELALTVDGGAHWTRQELPTEVGKGLRVAGARLYPVGDGAIVLDVPGSLPPEAVPDTDASPSATPDLSKWKPGQRWYTADGGRTWQRRARVPAQAIEEIPPGGRLILPLPDPAPTVGTGSAFATRAQVLMPDGSVRLLTGGPSGQGFTDAPVTVAADGRIWVPGFAMNPKTKAVAVRLLVSGDRGRTFARVSMPKISAPPTVVTGDGRAVHLVEYDGEGAMRIQRTTNGGTSWQELKPPPALKVQRGEHTQAMIDLVASGAAGPGGLTTAPMRDGSLLLSNGSNLFRLAPGATTFTKVAGVPTVFGLIPAGPVTLAFGLTKVGTPTFYATTDGKRWVPFALS